MRVSRCDLVAEREAVPNSPAYFAEGIKEVRSPGRTKERKGAEEDSASSRTITLRMTKAINH